MFENVYRITTPPRELDWGWALPSVVRLLADPAAYVGLPACPLVREPGDQSAFGLALGYWTALDHMLRYQLGWTYPAQGLARWLDEAPDGGGTVLGLVRHIWLGDGFLFRYLAWRVDQCRDHVPVHWQDRIATRYIHGAVGEPTGPWQLHLEEQGMHVLGPAEDVPPEQFVVAVEPEANYDNGDWVPDAMIMFDDANGLESGWYGYLTESDPRLSSVDVYSRQFGYCGLYRRSPSSGRWHTASEHVHQWGIRP